MNIKNREKLLAFAAIVGLTLVAGESWVLKPLVRTWNARSERILRLTKDVNKGLVLLERERTIRNGWAHMKTNALPADPSTAQDEVTKSVFRWQQESGFALTSTKPQKRQAEDYTTIEFRADGSGNIDAVKKFLYELEKDPLALKIEDLEITARDSEGQQLSLGVRFSGLLLGTEER